MIVSAKKSSFEACSDFTGRAVIVDIPPPRKQPSPFGERDVTKVVIEVDLLRKDGTPYYVWSKNMTPSLHEKSNLRKFIKSVLGRDLTRDELKGFDLETLVGLPVHVVVVQNQHDGETYANIAVIQPHKIGEPLRPSGKYVRVKDRPPRDGNSYRRAEQPAADARDLGATKIHIGKCKNMEVRDLSPEQVLSLVTNWLPLAKANTSPTADDRRLIAALEQWQSQQPVTNIDDDNVPY